MIVHGWKNLGEKTLGSATAISEIATSIEAEHYIDTDGFNYCLLAVMSVTGNSDLDIWGTQFDSESTQNFKTVINTKIGSLDSNATESFSVPAGYLGNSVAMEWSRINDWADATSTGNGKIAGLMSRVNGYAGPEVSQTGTAANTFGTFVSDGYITQTGAADGPGFVIIPCGLFSGLQLTHYSGTSELGCALACLIQ